MYQVINKNPPLWWILKLFFPAIDRNKTIVTFGNKIYSTYPLPGYVLAHEEVHCRQQRGSKLYACWHFIKYLCSTKFRYQSELEAFRAEFQYALNRESSWQVSQIFHKCVSELSGPIYKFIVTPEKARKDLLS